MLLSYVWIPRVYLLPVKIELLPEVSDPREQRRRML